MLLLGIWSLERLWRWQSKLEWNYEGRFWRQKVVEVFQENMLWQAFLSKVLNLRILLPENNNTEWLVWLVGLWTVEFFPTNSIVTCALRSKSEFKILNPARCYVTGEALTEDRSCDEVEAGWNCQSPFGGRNDYTMMMENWVEGGRKWEERNPPQCHVIHHQSYTGCRRFEPKPPQWKASIFTVLPIAWSI